MLELEEGTLVAAVVSLLQQLDVDNVEVMMTLEDYSLDLPTIHPVVLKTIRHHYYYLMTCSYYSPPSGRMVMRMSPSLMTRMEQQLQQQLQ